MKFKKENKEVKSKLEYYIRPKININFSNYIIEAENMYDAVGQYLSFMEDRSKIIPDKWILDIIEYSSKFIHSFIVDMRDKKIINIKNYMVTRIK